jgi:hypothetical protein
MGWVVVALLATGTGVPIARGDLITWEFEGVLTSVNDYTGFLGPSVFVGAPFLGQLTFEASTLDTVPSDPRRGVYLGAGEAMGGTIGDNLFIADPASSIDIRVAYDEPSTGYDSIWIGAGVRISSQPIRLAVTLIDEDGLMLSSDALPTQPPSLDLTDVRGLALGSEPLGISILGELTTLVPEPSSLLLWLGIGVVVAFRTRRQRPRTLWSIAALHATALFAILGATVQPVDAQPTCDPSNYDCTGVTPCRCMDLAILWDLTPSLMDSFQTVQSQLRGVLEKAWCHAGGAPGDLHVGLIVFFNTTGQGRDTVKVEYPLTTDVQDVCVNGIGNPASGVWMGQGFGPEASDEALHEMLGATAWAGAASCIYTPEVRFTVQFRQQCRKIAILITDAVPGICNENASTCEARLQGYRWADQAAAAGIELAAVFVFNDYAEGEREDDAQEILREYVRRTHGLYVQLPANGAGLADALEPVLARCPDCNGNQVDDWADIVAATSTDCDLNGIPDECEPDCDGNDVADPCQVPTFGGTDADCDLNGSPDHCQADCDDNGTIDPCQVAPIGFDPDCDCNAVPDQCDPDCDNSGVVDACDDCEDFPWDFDRDCDVDLPDFGSFQLCVSSNGMASRADCYCAFDVTGDSDVEVGDYPAFEMALAGPPEMGGCSSSPPPAGGPSGGEVSIMPPEPDSGDASESCEPGTVVLELRSVGAGAAVTTLTAHTTYEVHYATNDLTAVNYFVMFGVTDSPETGLSAAAQATSGDWAGAPWFAFWDIVADGLEPVRHAWMPPGFARYQVTESEYPSAGAEGTEDEVLPTAGPSGLLCTITTGEAGELYLELYLALLDPVTDSCEEAYGLAHFNVIDTADAE